MAPSQPQAILPCRAMTSGCGGAIPLRWRRFADGALALTETVILPLGEGSTGAIIVDPRNRSALNDGQYSVTIDAENGPAVAIAIAVARGGDRHMIYEGFPAP